MAEKSLYSTAIYHHQQALVFKQEGKFEQAKATFESAAKAYDTYLKRFPRSKNAYEMEFYLAECLYNSLQFSEAARHYAAVRDSSQDVKYQAESSFSAVLSWQKQVELDTKEKKCPELKVLKSSERPENEKPKLLPICESAKALVAAADAYVKSAKPDDDKVPNIANVDAKFHEAFSHGVPTDYGKVGIGYRKDMVSEPIASWADLWSLAPKYSGKIVFLDFDRDTIGSALRYKGFSGNTQDESELEQAKQALIDIKPHLLAIKGYDVAASLVKGDAAIVMDWDYDVALGQG